MKVLHNNRKIFFNIKNRKYTLIICLILCLSFILCSKEILYKEIFANAYSKFDDYNDIAQKLPEKIDVLIDITGSMEGFSASGTPFSDFLESFNYKLNPPKARYYKFHKSIDEQRSFIPFTRPETYKGMQTHYALIEDMIKEDNIVVIFTDLQFNTLEFFNDNVLNFQNLIKKNKYIKIFSSQIDFDGTIIPQMVSAKAFSYKGKRPIYAIAIGNKQYENYISESLADQSLWQNEITLNKYSRSNISVVPQINSLTFRKNHNSSSKALKSDGYEKVVAKLTIENEEFKNWPEFNRENIIINSYAIKGDTVANQLNIKFIIDDLSYNTNNIMTFTITSESKVNTSDPVLLRILIKPVKYHEWIYNSNCTVNDNYRIQADHTLKLADFFESIISSISEPYYSTFGYVLLF